MKVLVEFFVDCGRMGSLDGMTVTTQETLDKVMGTNIWFDEPLGKHSEYDVVLDESNLKVITDDQDFLDKMVELVGWHVSGFDVIEMAEERISEDEE